MRPQALNLSLTHRRPWEWTVPYLAATVLVVVMVQALPLHQRQVLPRLNVVAKMDEDFSIAENLAFVEREKGIQLGDLVPLGVPVTKQSKRATCNGLSFPSCFLSLFFFLSSLSLPPSVCLCVCVCEREHTEIMPYIF